MGVPWKLAQLLWKCTLCYVKPLPLEDITAVWNNVGILYNLYKNPLTNLHSRKQQVKKRYSNFVLLLTVMLSYFRCIKTTIEHQAAGLFYLLNYITLREFLKCDN